MRSDAKMTNPVSGLFGRFVPPAALVAALCFSFPAFADLPVPVRSPNVEVGSPKSPRAVYAPGEVAGIEVKVKNKSAMEIQAIILLDIVLPDGATQQLRSDVQAVDARKSKTVSVQYAIPADAPNGTYYARVYIRNPYIREPYYVDDAVKVFEVKGGRALDTEVEIVEKTVASDADWPGAAEGSGIPVKSMPFAPKQKSVASTLTPEFTWPRHPQAVSYKVYVSKVPFSSANVIMAQGVTDLKYTFDPEDASLPLADGRTYAFTILPKNSAGSTMVGALNGFFSTFTVQIADHRAAKKDALDIKLNDISTTAASSGTEVYWNKEDVPAGTLTISGTVPNFTDVGRLPESDEPSYWLAAEDAGKIVAEQSLANEKIRKVWISTDNGANFALLTLEKVDASTGAFSHVIKLTASADYYLKFKVETTTGRSAVIEPSGVKIIHYKHADQAEALKELLNNLKNALVNNDRAALMDIIHPDWISTDADFVDKSKFENTIRELFTKTTTTLITWSTENTDIISPGRRVTLTCTWRQKMTHPTFNATRDINTTLRLDVRRENGKWLIREDIDLVIFRANFGMTLTVNPHGLLPPGYGTR